MHELIDRFLHNFFGYGNLKAPIWFIGMEEGGGKDLAEAQARIEAWQRLGAGDVIDLVTYHRVIDKSKYFDRARPPTQPTWRGLIRILLGYQRYKRADIEAIRDFQANMFGTPNSNHCLLELMPLASRRITSWIYTPWAEEHQYTMLQNRRAYRNQLEPQRINTLATKIRNYRPRNVVFYGRTYLPSWKSIVQAVTGQESIWTEETPDPDCQLTVLLSPTPATNFFIVNHSTSRGVTENYFLSLGRTIHDLA
nr:hypothetical protein [uncultured Deefgea sp.]